MRLRYIKYGLTVGAIGVVAVMASYDEPEYQGVVVNKHGTSLCLDLNSDSAADVVLAPYECIMTGSNVQNDIFKYAQKGDTIKYITMPNNSGACNGIIRAVNGLMPADIMKKMRQDMLKAAQLRSKNR